MSQSIYRQQVELLIRVAPIVFASRVLALKGGTGINLFLQNMPRISVDLDCVFLDKTLGREEAIHSIRQELARIKQAVQGQGYRAVLGVAKEDVKCIVSSERAQVKIEVNPIFRGTILPVQRMPLCEKASDEFFVEYEVPVLCRDELYAGKILAALDRQHPRDFFDVREMMLSGGITDEMIECLVVYLCAHNRPFHETLFSATKNQEQLFKTAFVGMTEHPCSWEELSLIRPQLQTAILQRLGDRRVKFLKSFADANPRWDLCKYEGVKELPAIRWKLQNLKCLGEKDPAKFKEQKEVFFNRLDASQESERKSVRP